MAEKFRAPAAAQISIPVSMPVSMSGLGNSANVGRPEFAAPALYSPSRNYVVWFFAVAVTSVVVAAMVHSPTRPIHSLLIAMTPQTVSRAVTAPPLTQLREVLGQDLVAMPPADPPPLAGLATLRDTIQSRQIGSGQDIGLERSATRATGEGLHPAKPDTFDAIGLSSIAVDEFGSGQRAPGICELPDVSGNGTLAIATQGQAIPKETSMADTAQALMPSVIASNAPISQPEFGIALAAAAQRQTADFTVYTDKYRRMSYPMGDVPALFGVCTDVVIRAYRALGVDLQALIHIARIGPADTSIAHRRTFTLRRYFASRGASLPITEFSEDYRPGDIVTYHRPQNRGSRDHIAIVSNLVAPSGRPMIVHNRGWGPQIEDALFVDKMTGHYRYRGASFGSAGIANGDVGSRVGKGVGPVQKPRAAEAKSQAKSRGTKAEPPTLRR